MPHPAPAPHPTHHPETTDPRRSIHLRPPLYALTLLLLLSSAARAQKYLTPEYYRAIAHLEQGRPDSAARILDSLTARRQRPQWLLACGQAHLAMGQPDSAQIRFAQLQKVAPGPGTLALAQLACYQHDTQRGIALLKNYLEQQAKESEQALRRDTLLRPCHQSPSWDSLWLQEWYTVPQQHANFLQQLADDGHWQQLLAELEALAPRQQLRHQNAYLRALALYATQQPHQALPYAERAQRLRPKETAYTLLYVRLLVQLGHPRRAEALLRKMARHDPHRPAAAALRAAAQLALERYHEAYSSATQCLALYPSDTLALRIAAYSAARRRNATQALRAIAALLPLIPEQRTPPILALRAQQLNATGNPLAALTDLQNALRIAPNDTAILLLAAHTQRALYNSHAACRLYRAAHQNGHPTAIRSLQLYCPATLREMRTPTQQQ